MMTRPALTAGLLAASLVLLSLFDHVRPYFTAPIGLGMMLCCAFLAGMAIRGHTPAWLLLLVPVMLLWNPVAPVPVSSSDFLTLCTLAIAGLLFAAFRMRAVRVAGPTSQAPIR